MAIAPISLSITRTLSGRYDLRYPNGIEPSTPNITIAAIPSSDFQLTAGQAFSRNFATYASGSDLSGATYGLQYVSGATLTALGLAFSTSTVSGATPIEGTGIFYLQITKSDYPFVSNQFSITVNPAPITDTQVPAEVFGLQAVNVSTTRNDLTIDWSSDVRTPISTPTDPVKIVIERQVDGGAFSALTTLTAGASQPTPALTFTAIGVTGASGNQSGPDLSVTVADGVYSSTQDAVAFYGGFVSGDFEISVKNPDVSSGYSWSGAGLMVRQNRTSMCASVAVEERTNTNPAGAPCHFRSQQGGTLSYTPDAQIAPGTPSKLVRTGNLFTYQVWDTSAQGWLTIGSNTVAMTDPVEAGVHAARGAPGDPITVSLPQFRINKLGTATYQDTTVTAGHTYGYRARARDSASPANDSAVGPVSTASTSTGSNLIRFTPGYYMALNVIIRDEVASTQIPQIIGWINELANETHVKGVKVYFQWRALEGNTAGDYTTGIARVRQLRDACAAVGKKLWLSFMHVVFGGTASDWTLYWPGYIVNSIGGSYGITVMTNGKIARIWQAPTMTRVIAQTSAYANADNGHGVAFKDDPVIECFQIDETAIGVATGVDGMSQANVLTQYQRWMTEMRAAFPTLPMKLTANFLGTSDQMWDVLNTAVQNKIMVGGPDTILTEFIDANRIFTGTTPAESLVTDQTRPITDRRGVVPFVSEVQTPSMGGHEGNWTMEQLVGGMFNGYSWVRNVNGQPYTFTARGVQPQYIHIARQEGSTTGINWNSPRVSDGAESVLSYIRRTNGAVYSTARPSGYF